MELVKHTPEEQARINHDKALPHVSIVILAPLSVSDIFQDPASDMIEQGMVSIKRRADAAKMIVLSTSISTNTLMIDSLPFLSVMILCQWAEIEKLEEQQRRQFLAAGGGPGPRRGA